MRKRLRLWRPQLSSEREAVGLEELDEEEVEVVAATVVCGFQTGKGMHVEGLS